MLDVVALFILSLIDNAMYNEKWQIQTGEKQKQRIKWVLIKYIRHA